MWNELVPHPMWWIKIEDSGMKCPSSTAGPQAQGSSARKTSPHNLWLQKPEGIESVEETAGAPSSSS